MTEVETIDEPLAAYLADLDAEFGKCRTGPQLTSAWERLTANPPAADLVKAEAFEVYRRHALRLAPGAAAG